MTHVGRPGLEELAKMLEVNKTLEVIRFVLKYVNVVCHYTFDNNLALITHLHLLLNYTSRLDRDRLRPDDCVIIADIIRTNEKLALIE